MDITFDSRFHYVAACDAVLLRAFVGDKSVNVLIPTDVLARRYGALAGVSKELAAHVAILDHRRSLEAEAKELLAAGVPEGGVLTLN